MVLDLGIWEILGGEFTGGRFCFFDPVGHLLLNFIHLGLSQGIFFWLSI